MHHMTDFEAKARALGWVTDEEKYPGPFAHHGVVHPDGWWAPDWESACKGFGDHKAAHDAGAAYYDRVRGISQ
jgi:hypothetical protein